LPEETPEEDIKVDYDQRTEAQASYNLRPSRARNYNNRLAHAIYDPANTQSYEHSLFSTAAICDFLRREDELMTELLNQKQSTSY
jgi:hypothetical protein